jgi:hypothetical protein
MVPKPLEPLNLEEIKFWLHIMQDHTVIIESGLPCDETELINEVRCFYQDFKELRSRAERVQSDKKFLELVENACKLVKEFYRYKRRLLKRKLTCRLAGSNYPLLLDHVSREADYFLRMLNVMKASKRALGASAKAREDLFWLRIMADHAKFICHLLDPSEKLLIETAREFSQEFDTLFLQDRDFVSMQAYHAEIAAFRRFLQDTRAATIRLRDFKKAAYELIQECKLVGIMPAFVADHLRREADHFLMILSMLDKGIIKCLSMGEEEMEDMDDGCEEDEEETIGMNCQEEEQQEPEYEVPQQFDFLEGREEEATDEFLDDITAAQTFLEEEGKMPPKFAIMEEEEEVITAEEIVETKQSDMPENPEMVSIELPQEQPETAAIVQEKQTAAKSSDKYNWSAKWPRPLGKAK